MDRDFLVDLFSDFGPVTIRPMFSGFGISVDGINFALALLIIVVGVATLWDPGAITNSIAKSHADLAKVRSFDWEKLNPQRGALIERFNREIKL